MDAIHPQGGPLALEPLDVSPVADGPVRPIVDGATAPAVGEREVPMASADKFLASAIEEYQDGQIDQALWARASAQSGDDESLVIAAYLRARATALQLQKRDRRRERRASRTNARQDTRNHRVEPKSRSEIPSAGAAGVRFRGVQLSSKFAAAAAAAVLASVVAAAWLIASPQESESIGPPSVSAVKPSTKEPAASRVGGTQPVAVGASGGASEGDSVPELKATVQQLKDTGNWNVFVLYAAKWTRDDPNNAAAWNELSIGYTNLHQYDDALVAATKAVELSPAEAPFLRNLGHLNITLERLPEAGSAFERALAANSGDADALCGAALVAHRLGRTNDAEAIARRVKSSDGSCQGLSDGESVAVVVGRVGATKRASSVPR
jgi:tetratricopeptide (TPR) repeat protein